MKDKFEGLRGYEDTYDCITDSSTSETMRVHNMSGSGMIAVQFTYKSKEDTTDVEDQAFIIPIQKAARLAQFILEEYVEYLKAKENV